MSSSKGSPFSLSEVWACVACVGVLWLAAGAVAQEQADFVPAEEIKQALSRGMVLASKVKKPPPPPAPPQKLAKDDYVSAETANYVSLQTVGFELDSVELTESAKRQLDEVARALSEIHDEATRGLNLVAKKPAESTGAGKPSPPAEPVRIVVQGHTCNRGTAEHNRRLSERRAEAVRAYLVAKGVRSEILETHGWGMQRPIQPNTTEENRALNRRVDFLARAHDDVLLKTRAPVRTTTSNVRFLDVKFEAIAHSEGGKRYVDKEINVLHRGDLVRAEFRVLEGCHVYGLLLDSQGAVSWLFPPEDVAYGLWCYFGETYRLPAGAARNEQGRAVRKFFVLDDHAGTEIFYIVATPEPLRVPEALGAILKEEGADLTAEKLRDRTGTKDAELHMLLIDHQ